MTRRQWLAGAAATLARPVFATGNSLVVGANLDPLSGILSLDAEGTLDALAKIGYRSLEGSDRLRMTALAPRATARGMTVRCTSVETPLVTGDWELYPGLKRVSVDEAVGSLKMAGIEYCTQGYISPGARGDADDFYRRTADRMNVLAERCRRVGLKFMWRNHAFEFAGKPGLRAIDIYRQRLDAALVGFELDCFWAGVAGQNPLTLMKDWKGRVWSLRLADKTRGTPVAPNEELTDGAFTEPGSGPTDLASIAKAAAGAGCRYYFVGPERARDPIESLRKSFSWAKSAGLV
jgi:sugar phosphate isomerase/epimerase